MPPPTLGRGEIAEFAYRLAAYHAHGDDSRLVHRMSDVLARAAVRIAELDRAGPETQPHAALRAARKEVAPPGARCFDAYREAFRLAVSGRREGPPRARRSRGSRAKA